MGRTKPVANRGLALGEIVEIAHGSRGYRAFGRCVQKIRS
jgi:hypothetical protein